MNFLPKMIHEKNKEKRIILQKKILQYSKSVKLQDMNQLDLDAQLLICSWTYKYLMAISIEQNTEKEKKDIYQKHQEIIYFFPSDLTITEYQWVMNEFQNYLWVYQSFNNKKLSNMLNYLKDGVIWEQFLTHLQVQEVSQFKLYAENHSNFNIHVPIGSDNLKSWHTFHQKISHLKKIDELRKIAQELQTIWYFFCIPIPVYWNGIQKGLAIKTLLDNIPDPQNFDFEDPENQLTNTIKKTMSASRWVWHFNQKEEGGESQHPYM